jgi:ABC-2 type transport system permease protein
MRSSVLEHARAASVVTWAFVRMGARSTFSYPLAFVLMQFGQLIQVVAYYFLEHVVKNGGSVGGDYLAFAAIGLSASQLTSGGILGLGQELDMAIQQGRLEMLLIEPVRWRLIPLALATWPTLYRAVDAVLVLVIAWGLGAVFVFHNPVESIVLLLLAIASGLVIGVVAASVRVIAKRGDPIATLYTLAAMILSGQFIPINTFPKPLQALSLTFPATYVIAGLRKTLMPDASGIWGPDPIQAIVILGAFCLIFLPFSLWVFGRSLEFGRRYGVLAGY